MLRPFAALALVLVGCVTDEVALQPPTSSTALDAPASDTRTFAPSDPVGETPPALVSGRWAPVAATLVEDPCGLAPLLDEVMGVELGALLPGAFHVAGGTSGFRIQALDYGAQAPITCDKFGDRFDCETQVVEPVAFGLGDEGWTYAIDFAGEIEDKRRIIGTAVVAYPTVSLTVAEVLQSVGLTALACTQVLDLELELQQDLDPRDEARPGGRPTPPPT